MGSYMLYTTGKVKTHVHNKNKEKGEKKEASQVLQARKTWRQAPPAPAWRRRPTLGGGGGIKDWTNACMFVYVYRYIDTEYTDVLCYLYIYMCMCV